MSMQEWAERECRIACKNENPDFDFDNEEDFDYGCNCYKSALKAYKSLMEDGHSGMSFSFTKNILIRLMEGKPLVPITDKDFFNEDGSPAFFDMPDDYLKERGLKSEIQCPRMSSLFRKETLDGKVSYTDVDRSYFINIENPSETYTSNSKFLDELYPITMPYTPDGKYKIYAQTFLTDKANGDFDTRGIFYLITPKGKRVDLNLFYTEIDGEWTQITKLQYETLREKRIDTLKNKVAEEFMWTLICNCKTDKEIEKRKTAFNKLSDEVIDKYKAELVDLCTFYENPDHYKYNTFDIQHSICDGETEKIKDVPELVRISEFLQSFLKDLLAGKL